MRTLKDESCVVIKAYKFTVFEILKEFLYIIIYCMSVLLSLHIESTTSMILFPELLYYVSDLLSN